MEVKIKARVLPYDFVDLLIASVVVVVWVGSLVLISALCLLISFRAAAIAYIAGFALMTFGCLYVVTSLFVGAEGIGFRRVLGKPKRLLWSDILSIEEVSPREVLLHGWLRLPMRSTMLGMCARHHIRIEWKDGCWYFPPQDVKEFLRVVADFAPHVLKRIEAKPCDVVPQ